MKIRDMAVLGGRRTVLTLLLKSEEMKRRCCVKYTEASSRETCSHFDFLIPLEQYTDSC